MRTARSALFVAFSFLIVSSVSWAQKRDTGHGSLGGISGARNGTLKIQKGTAAVSDPIEQELSYLRSLAESTTSVKSDTQFCQNLGVITTMINFLDRDLRSGCGDNSPDKMSARHKEIVKQFEQARAMMPPGIYQICKDSPVNRDWGNTVVRQLVRPFSPQK